MVDQTIQNRKAKAQALAQAIIQMAIHPVVVGAGRHQVDHPTVCKTLNQPSHLPLFKNDPKLSLFSMEINLSLLLTNASILPAKTNNIVPILFKSFYIIVKS